MNRVSVDSDNGLLLIRRQAIIWTNAGLLSIGPLRTKFSEIVFKLQNFYSRKCIWRCHLWDGSHFAQGGDEVALWLSPQWASARIGQPLGEYSRELIVTMFCLWNVYASVYCVVLIIVHDSGNRIDTTKHGSVFVCFVLVPWMTNCNLMQGNLSMYIKNQTSVTSIHHSPHGAAVIQLVIIESKY